MGMGTAPAGVGLAGADPAVGTPATARKPPAALYVNEDLDHELDEQGRYREVHPVDAAIWLSLRAVRGWIRSAIEVGHTVGQIEYIERATIGPRVDRRIREAVSGPLARGDIEVISIEKDYSVRGRIQATFNYRNLRDPFSTRPKRVTV